jgi:hypothetical protein
MTLTAEWRVMLAGLRRVIVVASQVPNGFDHDIWGQQPEAHSYGLLGSPFCGL